VTDSADLTPAQMSTIRVGWAVIWPLYAVALLVGLAGSAVLNNTLRATAGRRWARRHRSPTRWPPPRSPGPAPPVSVADAARS